MHCLPQVFSMKLWVGNNEMVILTKIGSGKGSGFKLDFHCSSGQHLSPSQLATEARMLICTWLTCFRLALTGFIFCAHISSKQGSRCWTLTNVLCMLLWNENCLAFHFLICTMRKELWCSDSNSCTTSQVSMMIKEMKLVVEAICDDGVFQFHFRNRGGF